MAIAYLYVCELKIYYELQLNCSYVSHSGCNILHRSLMSGKSKLPTGNGAHGEDFRLQGTGLAGVLICDICMLI